MRIEFKKKSLSNHCTAGTARILIIIVDTQVEFH